MPDDIQPGAFLVFRINHVPRCLLDVGDGEHLVLSARVLGPSRSGLEIHRAELPSLGWIFHAVLKSPFLLFIAHRKPVLDQDDASAHQHSFKLRTAVRELHVLGLGAESHHALNTGPVIPAAIKQDELASGRQMRDIALEVPLRLLSLRGGAEGDHAADARIQALRDCV